MLRRDVQFALTVGAVLAVTIVVYVLVLSNNPDNPATLVADSTTKPSVDKPSAPKPAAVVAAPAPAPVKATAAKPPSTPVAVASGSATRQRPESSGRQYRNSNYSNNNYPAAAVNSAPAPANSASPSAVTSRPDNALPPSMSRNSGYAAASMPERSYPPTIDPPPARLAEIPATRPAPVVEAAAPAPVQASRPSANNSSSGSTSDWDYVLNHGSGEPIHTESPTPFASASNRTANERAVASDVRPPMIDAPATRPQTPMSLSAPSTPAPAATVNPTVRSASNAPSAAGSAVATRTHVVATGESLWTIANAMYGNGSLYTKIVAANAGLDAKHLKVGMTLVIPPNAGSPTMASATTKPSAPTASAAHPGTPAPGTSSAAAAGSAGTYTVVARDTLQGISQKIYGTTTMTDKIYQLNQSLIGPNRDVLKIGWVLKLPEAPKPTVAER